MNRKLYRSAEDRVFAGVAGGMAATYDIDPALVRIGWVLLAIASGGIFIVVYLVMAIVVPLWPSTAPAWSWATAGPGGQAPPTGGQVAAPSSPGPEPGPAAPNSSPGLEPGPASAPPPNSYPPPWSAGYPPTTGRRRRSDFTAPFVFGLLLVLAGGYFLLRQFIPQLDLGLIWPVAVIVLGIVLIFGALSRNRP